MRGTPHVLGVLQLDQLQRFTARAFDHYRACVAERVRPLQKRDVLTLQLGDPRIEIGNGESNVIHDVPARARELVESIARVEQQYGAVAEAIVGIALTGDRDGAVGRMNERCRPLLAALVQATDSYIRYTAETSARWISGSTFSETARSLHLMRSAARLTGSSSDSAAR